MTTLAPADIDAAVTYWLRGVTAVRVSTMVPNPRPPEFVVVEKLDLGGPDNPVQDVASVLVQAWSTSQATAHTLARTMWARMIDGRGTHLTPLVFTHWVDATGIVHREDPDTGQHRQQFVATIRYRMPPI